MQMIKPIIIKSEELKEKDYGATKTIDFLKICKKCGAKCCKLGGSNFTLKERNKILSVGYQDHTIKVSDNHYEFISKKGICPYLNKDYSCSIYQVRPLACRCFPVHPEFVDNKKFYFLAQCPLGKFLSEETILRMKKEASKLSNKIIKERLEPSNLSESDLKLIKRRLKSFKSIKID